ncbi:HutD family protein [Acidisphaera sp. L21]|uniref:HutD/Ves family protein n=1 Tax=Acidisphaera sp. L21 TaxID=1641851 RepID=UPI00131DCE00|nr:HutD family protein [Acidisphaera sp. L21]
MSLEFIPFATLPITPWRNAAGRRANVASEAHWNVGFAWLDVDAPFSHYDGTDRTITLIDGPGFALEFVGYPTLRVDERYRPSAFDGGWPTECKLLGGPGMVLNAMTARATARHSVRIIRDALHIPQTAPDDAAAFFLVLLAGEATITAGDDVAVLQPRDAARISGRFSLQGVGELCLALITIGPR